MSTVAAKLIDGTPVTFETYVCSDEIRAEYEAGVKGLGYFAVAPGEFEGKKFWRWYYRAPGHPWRQVSAKYSNSPAQPPLPRPASEWRQCGCGKPHICTACAQPYWIEIHGVADGFCTYCYNAG